ncbi:alpha/beta hydrolase fold protein [Aspergillus sclerotialis]|uniref:Alpha/beta hydrolase fold protein n=1 Tax=Aspergillus sclerotialis TaxID=2070753 RepID=A0A3A2ZV58_9EURO|nr:alpha/beta hydrolase fold protein [Aspergillus sclerotialis]
MTSPVLHPEWLKLEQKLGGRSVLQGSPEEIRVQYNSITSLAATTQPPASPNVIVKDQEVEGIKCRVYTPLGSNGQGPLPVGVYTHGGGFVCGDLNSEDPLCRIICEHARCILVSVDYRLGPENKLPTMLEDTLAVYRWALANASQFGGDVSKFFSIGGSAGGGLALSVANHFAKQPQGRESIKGVVAITPLALHWEKVPSEYKSVYRSYDENAENEPVINKATMETFYAAVNANPQDSDIFTALSPHHAQFPPTYICTCGADPLRDDGRVMNTALSNAGVQTKLQEYPELPHYFWIMGDLEVSRKFVDDLIAGVQWVISQMD